MKYVVLLRGVNVGAKTKAPMSELKRALESLGFSNVKTILNSGNALFATDEEDISLLKHTVEAEIDTPAPSL